MNLGGEVDDNGGNKQRRKIRGRGKNDKSEKE